MIPKWLYISSIWLYKFGVGLRTEEVVPVSANDRDSLTNALREATALSIERTEFGNQLAGLSEFTKTLAFDIGLLLGIQSVPVKRIKEAVAAAASEANLPNPDDDSCERNYEARCPDEWLPKFGSEITCKAPPSYDGPCDSLLDLRGSTPLKKFLISLECGVKWPCKQQCVQDFSLPCPENYRLVENGFCQALPSYVGNCIRYLSFADYSFNLKSQWAEECETKWPCKKGCESRLPGSCPYNWFPSEDKKFCIALPNYFGRCAPVQLSSIDQNYFSQQCNVYFPCGKSDSVGIQPETECLKNYEQDSCPENWSLSQRNEKIFCVADLEYNGPCPRRFSTNGYTVEMKKAFEKRCKAPWKCWNFYKTPNKKHNIPSNRGVFHVPDKSSHVLYEQRNLSRPQSREIRRHIYYIEKFIEYAGSQVENEVINTLKDSVNALSNYNEDVRLVFAKDPFK